MLIVDFNQVVISNLFATLGKYTNAPIEEDLLRHLVVNSIRSYKQKFGDEYGEMVIAADGKNSWRKQVFPYYKANRKKSRSESEIDWTALFNMLSNIRDELAEYFPYRVICVDTAEADDVIATLVFDNANTSEKILILSDDKDHIQLQKFLNVKQYAPIRKKWLTSNNPEAFLKEHILIGDGVDGICNFLSDDDCLINPDKRQKKIMKKKLEQWIEQDPIDFCDEQMLRGYKRNQQLIDYDYIPEPLREKIRTIYESQAGKDRSKLFNYFMEKKLKHLMSELNSF